jgi:hypothetical protein
VDFFLLCHVIRTSVAGNPPLFYRGTIESSSYLLLQQWRKKDLGSDVSSPFVRFLNLAEREQLNDSKKTDWHSADALVTAVTLEPSLVGQVSGSYNAMPEVQGMKARGSLFVDYNGSLKNAHCNVVIIETIDLLRYKRMLLSYLA